MTQSFDDYRSTLDTTQLLMSANCCRHAFEAGAQSRQAEIDELKSKKEFRDLSQDLAIKNIKDNYEKQISGLAKTITKMDTEIDELLKIVKKLIDNTVIGIDYDVENQAIDLLKGTTNEQ